MRLIGPFGIKSRCNCICSCKLALSSSPCAATPTIQISSYPAIRLSSWLVEFSGLMFAGGELLRDLIFSSARNPFKANYGNLNFSNEIKTKSFDKKKIGQAD